MTAVALSLVNMIGVLPAGAATYRASLADVSVTLTYQGTYPTPRHTMLTIWHAAHVVYRNAVSASFCGQLCWPTPTYGSGSGSPVRVVGLRAGSPDVVLGLYSGGAHCCYLLEVFAWSSAQKYVKTEMNLGDPGARLEVLPANRYPAVVTADDAFAYAFTDFAASGLPIRIWRFSGHGFTNVTRQYPSKIRSDAASWLSAFYAQASTRYSDSVGVIAAWAADEYLLGRGAAVDQFLRQQARAGHLHSQLTPSSGGTLFVSQLEKFLVLHGY